MTAPAPLLEAHGLQLGYGRREVLRGVDITVGAGEVVALLGPNGAGKTTLMKVLVGLLSPRAGTVRGPVGRHVGWVPQGGAVWQRLTVRENLELFARLLDLPGQPAQVASAAAEAAHLQPWLSTLASDLSGGLRQRLNVAVGLLGDPSLLVLDEPTTGVDLVHRTALSTVLRTRSRAGCAVLLSTHSLEDAAIADRVVVVVGGRARYSGDLAGLADVDGVDDPAVVGIDPVSAGLLRLWTEETPGAAR